MSEIYDGFFDNCFQNVSIWSGSEFDKPLREFKNFRRNPHRKLVSCTGTLDPGQKIRTSYQNPYQLPKSVPAWIFGTVMPFMNNVIKASHRIDKREPSMPEISVIKRFVNEKQKYLEYLE